MDIRISKDVFMQCSNVDERTHLYTYLNRNPVAVDMTWRRLEKLCEYLQKYTRSSDRVLDFGGGSGSLSKALNSYYNQIDLLDIDAKCAKRIKEKLKLDNIQIYEMDYHQFSPKQKYNLIVAADVLEHISELESPVEFIKSNLVSGGYLGITQPTENIVYALGRLALLKKKPEDHYHTSKQVIQYLLQQGFVKLESAYIPKYIVPIPIFEIAIFRFMG